MGDVKVVHENNNYWIVYNGAVWIETSAPFMKYIFDEFAKHLDEGERVEVKGSMEPEVWFVKEFLGKTVRINISRTAPENIPQTVSGAREIAKVLARNINSDYIRVAPYYFEY